LCNNTHHHLTIDGKCSSAQTTTTTTTTGDDGGERSLDSSASDIGSPSLKQRPMGGGDKDKDRSSLIKRAASTLRRGATKNQRQAAPLEISAPEFSAEATERVKVRCC
jgi:hypothetical protein